MTDTARLNAIQEQCADVELTCGGVWRVSVVEGDFESPNLREAIDAMIAASYNDGVEPGEILATMENAYKRPL